MPTPRSPFRRTPAAQARAPHPLVVRAAADEADAAEILIYDEIGFWGIAAKDVVQALRGVTAATIHARINSPGGDVMDGVAIYNALRGHGARVITHIDGMAASIASVIALAGDEVRMAENAFFMIHDPWGITIGTATEHRKTADVLDKVEGVIAETYLKRAEAERDQVLAWMDEETWFTAEEAKDAGFVDEVVATAPVKAQFDLSAFRHAPAALRDAEPPKPTERDLERLLRDAGLSRSEAKAAIAATKNPHSLRDAAEAGVAAAQVGSDLLRHVKTLTQ